jgi:hypothetical protein
MIEARQLLLEVAIHEAGHSVIARVVGLKAGPATIRDGNAGSYFKDDGSIDNVLAVLAGRAATLEILGRADDYGCSIDDAQAMTLLTTSRFIEREPWYAKRVRQQCLDQARALIRKHRAAVEAVADALLQRETLSGAEIDRMMMDAEAWRRVELTVRMMSGWRPTNSCASARSRLMSAPAQGGRSVCCGHRSNLSPQALA